MFDLSITKLLVLGVLALVIFGPDQLPKTASQAGRVIRDLRRIAARAKNDLAEGLGPELTSFSPADLDPRSLVPEQRLDELDNFHRSGEPERPVTNRSAAP